MMFSYRFVKYVFLSLAFVFITFLTSCSSQPTIDEITVMPDGTILLVTHTIGFAESKAQLNKCKEFNRFIPELHCNPYKISWGVN